MANTYKGGVDVMQDTSATSASDGPDRPAELRRWTDLELLRRCCDIYREIEAISPKMKPLTYELSDIHCEQLVRAEDDAVKSHGRQILSAIEGTTWISGAGASSRDENDSPLVQMLTQAEVAS